MIDLHLHTTASDGHHTVSEVLAMCEEAGLDLISITDHWTMLGYDELKDPAVRGLFSGKILPGCEFAAHFKGQSIEILGYGVDPDEAREYLSHFPNLQDKRTLEFQVLLREIKKKGIPFDEKSACEHFNRTHDARGAIWKEINRIPENRDLYTNPVSAENSQIFTRSELSNLKSPFFIHGEWFSPPADTVCEFIRSKGGKAFIAHPLAYSKDLSAEIEELIAFAKPDGLEVWYPAFGEEQRAYLLSLCKKHDLLFSGGSDYHSEKRAERGYVIGLPQIADTYPLEEIMGWVEPLRKL